MFQANDRVSMRGDYAPDAAVGTVRQVGSSENVPSPDGSDSFVLVGWSRVTVTWEYAKDLMHAL